MTLEKVSPGDFFYSNETKWFCTYVNRHDDAETFINNYEIVVNFIIIINVITKYFAGTPCEFANVLTNAGMHHIFLDSIFMQDFTKLIL